MIPLLYIFCDWLGETFHLRPPYTILKKSRTIRNSILNDSVFIVIISCKKNHVHTLFLFYYFYIFVKSNNKMINYKNG